MVSRFRFPFTASQEPTSECHGEGVVRVSQTRYLRRRFHLGCFRIEGAALARGAATHEYGRSCQVALDIAAVQRISGRA